MNTLTRAASALLALSIGACSGRGAHATVPPAPPPPLAPMVPARGVEYTATNPAMTALQAGPHDAPQPDAPLDDEEAEAALKRRGMVEARLPHRAHRVGTNLAATAYWSNSFPFVDAFRVADGWISGHEGTWEDGEHVDTDAKGWVKSLKPGQIARAFLLGEGSHHAGGRFTVLYEGKGDLRYMGGVNVEERGQGHDSIVVSPAGALWLELHRTDTHNPIRNIRVLFPGGSCSQDALRACDTDFECSIAPNAGSCVPFTKTYAQRIFLPTFLAEAAPFSVLRFMDWQNTNFSRDAEPPKLRGLASLPKRDSAFWHPIPVEVMVELANTLNADPWFCMPTQADDELVREFATQVKKGLREERKVYVEYSNEFWNDIFGQNQWVKAEGCKRYSKQPAQECGTGGGKLCKYGDWNDTQVRCAAYGKHYFAERTVEVGAQFRKAFGPAAERVQRVMATQVGGAEWWIPDLLEVPVKGKPARKQIDLVAVAPYFGGEIERPEHVFEKRSAPQGSGRKGDVDRALFGAVGKEDDCMFARVSTDVRALASRYPDNDRPRYGSYEGGQHLFTYDEGTMHAFLNMNRDPRMEGVYDRYLSLWRELTNDALFMHFTTQGHFNNHGAWGAKEWQGQPTSDAPKFRALQRYVYGP
jgi:hypothetical protein